MTSPYAMVIKTYNQTHQAILRFLQKLSDEQLHWGQSPESHTIAFHGWHVARWADYFFQACIPGMTPELGRRLSPGVQIWYIEALADRWGFTAASLGFNDTGMSLPDETAVGLPIPAKAILLDYLERAFAAADRVTNSIDEQQFLNDEQPQPLTDGIWGAGTVGDAVIAHIIHDNRHMGMMECLLGLQGQPGTATL